MAESSLVLFSKNRLVYLFFRTTLFYFELSVCDDILFVTLLLCSHISVSSSELHFQGAIPNVMD
jgi:hypothetical protein